jgi:hypothetical protein
VLRSWAGNRLWAMTNRKDRKGNHTSYTQNAPPQEEERERKFRQPRTSLPDTQDSERDINLGIDFDSPEVFERRLMRAIFEDFQSSLRL